MAEERVPAGWYPDPSGLPQLRWWDNHKWTEFVSDSQVEEETVEEEVAPATVAEPVRAETIVLTQESRPAIGRAQDAHPSTDLGSAFDAVFGGATLAPEPVEVTPEPEPVRLADAFDAAFGASFDDQRSFEEPRVVSEPIPEPISTSTLGAQRDPLETMFAHSATSPVGVGTSETIGEALMRALQSA